MFRSQKTGKLSEKNESPLKVITAVREVTYVNSRGKVSKGFEPVSEIYMLQSESGVVQPTALIKSDKTVTQKRQVVEYKPRER